MRRRSFAVAAATACAQASAAASEGRVSTGTVFDYTPAQAARDWDGIAEAMVDNLARRGVKKADVPGIVARMKVFYEFCGPLLRFEFSRNFAFMWQADQEDSERFFAELNDALSSALIVFHRKAATALLMERLEFEAVRAGGRPGR